MESTTDLCGAPELVEPVANPEQPEAACVEPLVNPEHPETVYREIIRATHWWVLYGSGGFAVACILIGAVEGLFGR
ncbi:MAG TPA: hypothetical protein VMH05_12335 [Bryobacteraceae bacterium]|nr:hypothetical protein [Bryobacteraceae bacterium]